MRFDQVEKLSQKLLFFIATALLIAGCGDSRRSEQADAGKTNTGLSVSDSDNPDIAERGKPDLPIEGESFGEGQGEIIVDGSAYKFTQVRCTSNPGVSNYIAFNSSSAASSQRLQIQVFDVDGSAANTREGQIIFTHFDGSTARSFWSPVDSAVNRTADSVVSKGELDYREYNLKEGGVFAETDSGEKILPLKYTATIECSG